MSLRRSTAEVAFAGDLTMPGALQLALRRSPLAHARVRAVDATAASGLPGVVAVLTSDDSAGLLSHELRFVGDRLAVAAAEDVDLARRAVETIAIDLEPLPATLDAEADAGNGGSADRLSAAEGDVDAALAAAEHVVDGEWRLPFVPGVSLEPPQVITWLDEDRRLVVRTSAGSPARVRSLLAERLSLPAARIRVVRPRLAGGADGVALPIEDLCALVTLRSGRPARLLLDGDDQLSAAAARPAQRIRVRLGVRDARIVALDLRFTMDLGAESEGAGLLLRSAARQALGVYSAPAMRLEATAVRSNRPPVGQLRGSDGGPAFAVECAVDEAARICREDPIAFRYRQLRAPGQPGSRLLAEVGEPAGCDDARPATALLALLPRSSRRPRGDATTHAASGIAVARRAPFKPAGTGPAASLRLLDDGSFALAVAAATAGADEGTYADAAATILTVAPDRVVCAAADTDSAAFEASDVSATPFAAGRAVEEAAQLAREKIREAGAQLLACPPEETTVAKGRVHDEGGRSVAFATIGAAGLQAGRPLVVTAVAAPPPTPLSLAAAHAEVAVDPETGAVRLRHLHAAVAAGPFADPLPHQALVEGALAASIEDAFAAELPFDDRGRPLLRSVRDWPLVAAIDVPPLSVSFLPLPQGSSPFDTAALAEVCGHAALAAIANAVARATEGRVRRLPLTPPAVLDMLDGSRA